MPDPYLIFKLIAELVLVVVLLVSLWWTIHFSGKDVRRAQVSGIVSLAALTGVILVSDGWSVMCIFPMAVIAALAVSLRRSR